MRQKLKTESTDGNNGIYSDQDRRRSRKERAARLKNREKAGSLLDFTQSEAKNQKKISRVQGAKCT